MKGQKLVALLLLSIMLLSSFACGGGGEPSTVCVDSASFSFSAAQGGSNPTGQTLGIWNCGVGETLEWSLTSDADWLTFSPANGISTVETDNVAVSANISGMSEGSHTATITISAPGATNTPYTIPVSLAVYQPRFESAACPFDIPKGQNVECGYLVVPEDRSQPDGPTIRLAVAIFKSHSNNPAADPIVYLEGGPGAKALKAVPLTFDDQFATFLANRDLIIFDQRGVGYSDPALDCPEFIDLTYEYLDQDVSPEESVALGYEAACSCRDRLVSEGVNLAAYNSAESAADLNDLRLVLGYGEWNLFGVSYGTRLALTAMRDFPEGIRSVILDSTVPLQSNVYTELPANFDRALNVFFDGCASDPSCSKAYPDLDTVFWELVDELNDSPATFSVEQPLSGETYDVLVDGDNLIGILFESLYSTWLIPWMPKIIFEVRDSFYGRLAILVGADLAEMEFFSHGMYYSVQCGEEVHFTMPQELAVACQPYPELQSFCYDLSDPDKGICAQCDIWGAKEADPIENEPVTSDIPTLVLAGEYDPITPPAWGQIAAETLSNSFYFEFSGVGHCPSLSGEECPLSIALAFLDDPTKEPNGSCVALMSSPDFQP